MKNRATTSILLIASVAYTLSAAAESAPAAVSAAKNKKPRAEANYVDPKTGDAVNEKGKKVSVSDGKKKKGGLSEAQIKFKDPKHVT